MASADAGRDPGVEANARLTGYVGVTLLILLPVELVSGLMLKRLFPVHVLVGFLLVPPVLLKLGSVGYRFVRYYTGDARYRAAGAPALGRRLLGPFMVLLTLIVFGSGVELWLFGYRFGFIWVGMHHASAYLWSVAAIIHVLNYASRGPALAAADWRDHLGGSLGRRSLVVAALVLGAALAIAMLMYPSTYA